MYSCEVSHNSASQDIEFENIAIFHSMILYYIYVHSRNYYFNFYLNNVKQIETILWIVELSRIDSTEIVFIKELSIQK